MHKFLFFPALALFAAVGLAAETPAPFVTGLTYPESVCYGPNGLLYVSEIGDPEKDGDGKVSVIKDGKAVTYCDGLDNPKGIVFYKDSLFVTDVTKIWEITGEGQKKIAYKPEDFPAKPVFLNDLAIDKGGGIFLVSDSGDRKGKLGAVYRLDHRLHKVEAVMNNETLSELNFPNGVEFDGGQFAIVADMGAGCLYRLNLESKKAEKIAEGMDGADGLVWDPWGRFFITSWRTGKIFAIPRPGEKPILIGEGLKAAADLCIDKDGTTLLIPDMKSGTLTKLSTKIAGWEVDDSPLTSVKTEPAFPKLTWTGWDSGEDSGKQNAFRAILLTHAGDGSNRIFVPQQQGVIHVFKDGDAATKIFLDISKKVKYADKQNEEGLLGLAFHPKFKQNGEFFVFYTDAKADMANVVSRFKVKKDDPTVADPASEEEIIRFEKPYWNHDGGTILFGKDGYLYITHGDGGNGGDPKENGQNLSTLLGKVLRIDVDSKSEGKKYGIPKDNPFVGKSAAAPEVWCYGLRNVWRMAFDRETGDLWAGEVGQNLFEEINILKAGGNYGWNWRESLHPFGKKGVSENKDMSDPIWEYHHSLGLSITGGNVYRGKAVPELAGMYLYADYLSSKCWALKYDAKAGRVTANRPLDSKCVAPMSFGEDEAGETYIMAASPSGKGIFKFVK